MSFPHKCFLVLDYFARGCVAFDFKLPFYLYKHLELSKHEENAQRADRNTAVIRSAKNIVSISNFPHIAEISPYIQFSNLDAEREIHIWGLQQRGPGIIMFNLLLLPKESFFMITEIENVIYLRI